MIGHNVLLPFRTARAYLRAVDTDGEWAVRIELNCAECGNNHFNLDEGVTDQAVAYCRDCGHRIGTIADLKARVAEEVLKRCAAGDFA